MCGICGIGVGDHRAAPDPAALTAMNTALSHRGPDDHGTFVAGPVGLAMRRLSIIDVAGGHQPMHNEDGTVSLVFNGEIYNYRDLRSRLSSLGHRFRTESDTEVVAHAYEEWGARSLQELRGMFALGLWDARRRELLLAVDRFGIKPLYYSAPGTDIVFASELGALLESGRVDKVVDDCAVAEYFTLGYIPPPATIFRDVRKLDPGTLVRWAPGRGAVRERYWDVPLPSATPRVARGPVHTEVRELLRDAVRAHLVSDVPLGAFLSGGIDSSSVVALMCEVSTERPRTFTIGFEARQHDERRLARLVAERFETDHHELVLEPEAVDVLPDLVAHFHEPFADSSALPTYYVSKLARQSVKVALSGDGGDELFLGYTGFAGVELARLAQFLPAFVRRGMTSSARRSFTIGRPAWNDRIARWQKILADTALPPEAAYRSKSTMTGLGVVGPLLTAELRARLQPHDPFRAHEAAFAESAAAPPLERIVYASQKVSLAGDMLVKVDRMSMANSLEVRVPLLDHVLAEFVSGLPVSERFRPWRLKALLKDTMRDVLPPEVLQQRKHGFTVPLAGWFRGDLQSFAAEILLDGRTRARGFFEPRALEPFVRQHVRGDRNVGSVIWSLLVFELWCREALD